VCIDKADSSSCTGVWYPEINEAVMNDSISYYTLRLLNSVWSGHNRNRREYRSLRPSIIFQVQNVHLKLLLYFNTSQKIKPRNGKEIGFAKLHRITTIKGCILMIDLKFMVNETSAAYQYIAALLYSLFRHPLKITGSQAWVLKGHKPLARRNFRDNNYSFGTSANLQVLYKSTISKL
jgi:hypothetical protein